MTTGPQDLDDHEPSPLDELLSARDELDIVRFVDDDGARLRGPEVAAEVARLAGALRALGGHEGDSIVWRAHNRTESALTYRACWRIGAIAVPVHARATDAEEKRIVDLVRARPVEPGSGQHTIVLPPDAKWRDRGEPMAEVAEWSPDSECAATLFTAGSTGDPTGVRHGVDGLAYKAALMVDVHGLTPDDAVLMPAPLAHVSGLLNGVLVPGAVPCKAVLMERWDPERALDLIEQERVTFMVGPPTFFVSLWQASGFTPARVESLRLVSSGGAGVTEAFCREATERLGARVKRTYGSTEAPTVATSLPADPEEMGWRHDGHAIGEVELRVDPSSGELLVRGPELRGGYLDERPLPEDEWYRTGDLATITDDGWLTITGRLKDVIIRGGENIATAEVESTLEAHPTISHAVAVGYPDDLMGERVCAFVVASEPFDVEQCRAWFAEQGVAKFKTPERVVMLDDLPLLASGKPDRVALRLRAAGS